MDLGLINGIEFVYPDGPANNYCNLNANANGATEYVFEDFDMSLITSITSWA
jgi:hypothetical protein